MFARCSAFWHRDDFTRCFQQDVLRTLLPLIAAGLSLLYLLYQVRRDVRRSQQKTKSGEARKYSTTNGNGVGAHETVEYRSELDDDDDEDDGTDVMDESMRNENLSLLPTRSHNDISIVAIDRPRGEISISLIEELAVLAELAIHLAGLILQLQGSRGLVADISGVAVWAYIALLTSFRVVFSASSKFSYPRLWYHTALLYGFQWVIAVLVFRSDLINPHYRVGQALTASDFSLSSLLFLIALLSRKGNNPVELEYEDNLEPSREPLASIFSLASFSWADALVWRGFRRTLEQSDVWNLVPKDKSNYVLMQYKQYKRTSSLAWHLVKYFKRELVIQSCWAFVSGIVIFVPTLLLKVILQYVEDPQSTPRNAAWFYVILLFVSGLISALANGQALWIGRRICIRLRAIIIGEIYAKALRRRAGASSDKILGETANKGKDGNDSKQSNLRKALSFGRKKKLCDQKDNNHKKQQKEEPDDSQVTSGAIINLMAVDSFKVAEISAYLHFLWAETPVQFVLAIVLLYQILGNSSIVGIAMMALLLPVNLYVAKKFAAVQKKILAATDARIHTTNEVLTNIRIIKYFAWEQRFLATVDEKRVAELRHLRNRYVVWAVAATIWSSAPILITFLTFLFYTVAEKRDLVPSVAFTALSLFSLLRIPLDQLADMVAHVQESKVSVDRVDEYLNEPETDKYMQLDTEELDEDGEPILGFDAATFSWGGKEGDDFRMVDLDLRFKVGQLNTIIGPTGSGKTSLLMALLGEMTLIDGNVYLPGGKSREDLKVDSETGLTESVAYCAQQAWLVNGTVRENIVFASAWDAQRYKQVIIACSLQRDLEILDSGDQTLVGEKGVTLSGGQKQRISLARALYCNARHVLMDDILSAVDAHTAKWIFDKAIMGPLMYNRTCILVTHNAVLCLPQAYFAVVLDNGRIDVQGSAADVISSGRLAEDVSKFSSRPNSRAASGIPSRVPSDIGADQPLTKPVNEDGVTLAARSSDHHGVLNGEPLAKVISKDIPGLDQGLTSGVPAEGKSTGAIKLSIIGKYLLYMGGPFYWTLAAISFGLQQVSQVATNVWIREWANAYTNHEMITASEDAHKGSPITHVQGGFTSSSNCLRSGSCIWSFPFSKISDGIAMVNSEVKVDVTYYLWIYAALGFANTITTLLREAVLFGGSLTASKRIHRELMEMVTHAKFRFFDSTPLGQLMNRFSKDIEAVDQEIAPVAVGMVHCLFSIATIVVLISIITPGFLIAALFIAALYCLIGALYINSSRDLKRLESIQRSPLYQQFGESLSGMTTIRAYGDERRFIRENLQRVNSHSRPFIYLWAINRWLAFRVDVAGALVSFFTGVFVLLSVGRVDAGAAGLAMTYAVTFTENVLWFVRLYASNEQNMNAVERIKEYLDVDQEAALIVPDRRPEPTWPSKGAVEFVDYSTRYRKDFDLVLRSIAFKILPGEKVGVVGRTGAGKSSLALALFRALEAEEGKILVDEVDISLIGLQDLRENIVMVPQDPTLFTGSIRSNLDPFGLFTDEEIFAALRSVQLIGAPSGTPSRPSTPAPKLTRSGPSTPTTSKFPASKLAPSDAASLSAPTDSTLLFENKNIFRNLSSPIAESGTNLSQGQRQLLCLARAMLKNPKVLLMDEATASIDYATDAKIQETIREIKNTTITIAHRLQTIIDYDKVLVLDKGTVVEYGDPFNLVSRDAGIFRSMCEMTGDFDVLHREAKKAHDARKLVDDS